MSAFDCCDEAKRYGPTLELAPASEIVQMHSKHLQLLACPLCGALWQGTSELTGHKEWDYSFERVETRQGFDAHVVLERKQDELDIERAKAKYEEAGLDWRTGRKKQ